MNFFKLLQYDVGDGNRVKFWKHVWYGDCTLKATFLELYCLSRTKDSSVAEVMRWASGRIYWNFHFRHPLQDGEEESFDRFMDTFILQKCGGLVLIRFVGSQQGVEVLRLEIFIFFSTLILSLFLGGWCGNQRFPQGWLSFHV